MTCSSYSGWLLVLVAVTAGAADVDSSADHPMISRYEGAEIIAFKQQAFDEYALFVAPAKKSGGLDKNRDATQSLEGKITQITYQAPPERSTLEVFRNYSAALAENGFETVFECTDKACGGRAFNHAVASYTYFGEDYEDQRFLAARLGRGEGDVYVSLYAAMHHSGAAADNNRVRVQVDVIELQPMETNMVVVDADAMAEGLNDAGHIPLYGIYFDTDSAVVKPQSKETLDHINTLLSGRLELKLLVVGHTDNQGSLEHNRELSKRRASAVVEKLVNDYGVDAARLTPDGVAYLAPIATNRTEAGRALNRRVELVEN